MLIADGRICGCQLQGEWNGRIFGPRAWNINAAGTKHNKESIHLDTPYAHKRNTGAHSDIFFKNAEQLHRRGNGNERPCGAIRNHSRYEGSNANGAAGGLGVAYAFCAACSIDIVLFRAHEKAGLDKIRRHETEAKLKTASPPRKNGGLF